MFPTNAQYEPVNTASTLPRTSRTPRHLQELTDVSRNKADSILMALTYGQKPFVQPADMRCIRDMTGDRTLFDIEIEQRVDGKAVVQKIPVSQYAYATSYCLFLEGRPEHYLRLAAYSQHLMRGTPIQGAHLALEALEFVTSTFPLMEPPLPAATTNPLLSRLQSSASSGPALAADFGPPSVNLEPPPAAPLNRRQRRLALSRP